MTDPSLENLLRSLSPAALPDDLVARVATPPPPSGSNRKILRPRHFFLVALAAAACAVLIANWPEQAATRKSPASLPLSVSHQESTLLDERPLAVVEHEGRFWQITEQRWQDRELALCSTTPLRVHLAATRRELVCQPVRFD